MALPKVIQGTAPFVSAKDIDKGANWTTTLSLELSDSEFGIICVTPENVGSPWLNYEAGAISKSVTSRACPILLGVTKDELSGPLQQLQMTSLEHEDVVLLLKSLNTASGSPLTEADLEEQVTMWWPRLEERVRRITVPPPADAIVLATEPAKPESSDIELLEETLGLVRTVLRRVERLESALPRSPERSFWQPDFARSLRREGVLVTSIQDSDDDIELRVKDDSIPLPLPGRSWTLLSELAQRRGRRVRISDSAGFEAFFYPNGDASEPPF